MTAVVTQASRTLTITITDVDTTGRIILTIDGDVRALWKNVGEFVAEALEGLAHE